MPRHSRHVGQGERPWPFHKRASFHSSSRLVFRASRPALKFLKADSDVPWQRVVSSAGKISSRGPGTDGAQRQREALEEEGVEVRVTPGGEFAVDFVRVGWFPDAIDLQQHPINLDELQPIEDGPAEDHRDGTGAVNGDGGSIAVPGGDDLV